MSNKRNNSARMAQAGACNPIPLINALRTGIDEIQQEDPNWGTATFTSDPALRLIIHQLAYLFRVSELDDLTTTEYSRCLEAVRGDT